MKAAIFDMDGLLVDSETLYVDAFKEVCEIMGDVYTDELFKSCIGTNKKTQAEILKSHFGDDYDCEYSYDLTHQIMDRYFKEGRLELKEGAIEILEFFKSKGYKMAVASSNSIDKILYSLKITGITHYFDELVSGDMVDHGKPAPDIFLLAAEKLGTTPAESYVFEDSYNGIRAAHAGGFYTIMVPDLLAPNDEMREKSTEIIESLLNFCKLA
ncbi:MAG: HAD family phosphatase [Clostridia bacterium]